MLHQEGDEICCCMHAPRSETSMLHAGATVHCFPKVENDMAGKTCFLCCSQDRPLSNHMHGLEYNQS